jgi:hypothetical protein
MSPAMDRAAHRAPLAVIPILALDDLVRAPMRLKLGDDVGFDLRVSVICDHVEALSVNYGFIKRSSVPAIRSLRRRSFLRRRPLAPGFVEVLSSAAPCRLSRQPGIDPLDRLAIGPRELRARSPMRIAQLVALKFADRSGREIEVHAKLRLRQSLRLSRFDRGWLGFHGVGY